jgi:fluoroacetyl-CoA thioesterase
VPIEVGASTRWQRRVEEDMTADRWGNAGVFVLATPTLVGLFEATAVRAIKDHLEAGQSSVGTHVDIRHLKATPVGDTVTLSAEVTEVDGRRIRFHVKAEDSEGVAGEGTHERVLVDLERFMQRVRSRPLESR